MSVAEGSSSHPVSRKNGFDPNQPFEEVSKANRTAPIWKLFTQLGQLNKLFGKCHRCGQVYAGSNSTLERHEVTSIFSIISLIVCYIQFIICYV